jgi:hypothetical protein
VNQFRTRQHRCMALEVTDLILLGNLSYNSTLRSTCMPPCQNSNPPHILRSLHIHLYPHRGIHRNIVNRFHTDQHICTILLVWDPILLGTTYSRLPI